MTNQVKPKVVKLFNDVELKQDLEIEPHKMYALNPLKVICQTPKAVCIEAEVKNHRKPSAVILRSCWFPRSQMMGVYVPGWLLISKAKEFVNDHFETDWFKEMVAQGKCTPGDFYLQLDDIRINLDSEFLKDNNN